MNKPHLSVAIITALALSSTTIAWAEGGSHRNMESHERVSSAAPIQLGTSQSILKLDTSSTVPSFAFDTSTVTAYSEFDTSTATSNLDEEVAVSDDGESEDDSASAGLATSSETTVPQPKSDNTSQDQSEDPAGDTQD